MLAEKRFKNSGHLPIILVVLLVIFGIILFNQQLLNKDKLTPQPLPDSLRQLIRAKQRQSKPLHLPILMYHYIEIVTDERDTIRKTLSILPSTFEEQIKLMLSQSYTFVTLSQVSDYFSGKSELPAKPVVLTFDDGYRDFYTDVFPLLKKYRAHAVAYVVSGFLDTTKNYMTRDQLIEIAQSGLVEIGAHSANHAYLPYMNYADAQFEITQSKKDLETLTGLAVTSFAYPYGVTSSAVMQMVENAGFSNAVGVEPGNTQTWGTRFKLTRFRPGSTLGNFFLEMLR